MKWNVLQADQDLVKQYMNELDINEIMATILINRNVDLETANILLNNPALAIQDPKLLINSETAALEVIEAVENQAEIWVFGDYDVDGITSGYVMTDFLKSTTDNTVYPYYPNRSEGYGLNMDFCKTLVQRKQEEGIEHMLVITVDNGTSCIEEVQYLKDNGINIVVTDHHKAKATLPNCTVVNPHITDDPVYHHLCGCGVVYKMIQVIQDLVGMSKDYTEKYLFAVAFGTIADVMPMTPENIALIKLGLEQVNSSKCHKAIKYFKDYIGKNSLNPNTVAWDIAPRLNACGRMGDIEKSAALFYMDEDKKTDIMDIIIEIEELNEERKALTKKAEKEIEKMDFSNDYACIFDASDYPGGISGAIAGKMVEKFGKLALVVSGSDDVLVGSARSPEGLNLQILLNNELKKGNLISFGGHENAAGFTVHIDKLVDLQDSLNEQIKAFIEEHGIEEQKEPTITIDCEIDLDCLNKVVYEDINSLPYDNNGFASPVFSIHNLQVLKTRTSRNNENNICLTLQDMNGKQMDIWAWRLGELYNELGKPQFIDIVGTIDQNFMNKSQYTLNILDIKASGENKSSRAV